MEVVVTQGIVLAVMVALFVVTIKTDKTKITTRDMAIVAILCVLTAVLSKVLSIRIPPAMPIFVISFSASISIVIGILFSPKLALIAGLIIDVIGLLMAALTGDGSMPFLGFTLTAMLSCYIPSILIRVTKKQSQATLRTLIILFLVGAVALAGIYLFSVDSISIDQQKNDLTDSLRYTILGVLIVISIAMIIINEITNKKIASKTNMYVMPMQLTFIILAVEIICHIILTSIWINVMYGMPFVVGASTRIIKAVLTLPVNIAIIYLILRYIPNQYKQHLLNKE